jgi:hypothetical protein
MLSRAMAPSWCAVQNINIINDSVIGGKMMMSDDASTHHPSRHET